MSRPPFYCCARVLIAVAVMLQSAAIAQGAGREHLSPNDAARIGMVDAWQRQMTIARGLDGLADAQVFVDPTRPQTIVEVTSAGENGRVLLRIPADQADRFGAPIGVEEAERLAQLEIYKLRRRGIEATLSRREIPQIRLYVLGSDGTVEARDGESGRLLWTRQHGDPRLPSLPMAVNSQYVIFVNGMHLIVLDAANGQSVFTRRFRHVPVEGPAIVGDHVLTLCTGGRVVGMPLKDFNADIFIAFAAGAPLAAPAASPDVPRAMWPTDAGYVYAIDGGGQAEMAFRFRADGAVVSKPAASRGGRFYFATDRGQVYCVLGLGAGNIMWRRSLGDPVFDSPVLYGERLFVKTTSGRLHCFDATTGQPLWPSPVRAVEAILGSTGPQVFIRTTTAHLRALDAETGSELAEFAATEIVDAIPNPLTDRLYLLTSGGGIQCLRPLSAELPTMLMAEFTDPLLESTAEPTESEEPVAEPSEADDLQDAADPFDAGDGGLFEGGDPFQGSGDFGGGDEAFGGGNLFGE